MRTFVLALLIALQAAAVPATAQQTAPEPANGVCLDASQALEAAQAYESYCARCHQASELGRKWYGSTTPADEGRINDLALFLDRHSGCPHGQHELIARWLAEQTGDGQ